MWRDPGIWERPLHGSVDALPKRCVGAGHRGAILRRALDLHVFEEGTERLAKMCVYDFWRVTGQRSDIDLDAHGGRDGVGLLIGGRFDHIGREGGVGAGMKVACDSREREVSKELLDRTWIEERCGRLGV